VELRRNAPGAQHADVLREERVESADDSAGRDRKGGVEVCDLAGRMHARIGSPGSHHTDRTTVEGPKRTFEDALNRAGSGLALPACERAS
jgi:hypothetical protein